jgi:hypothetical protein
MEVLTIEWPFIKYDLDDTPAKKNADSQQNTQVVGRSKGQVELASPALDKQVCVQESQGIA